MSQMLFLYSLESKLFTLLSLTNIWRRQYLAALRISLPGLPTNLLNALCCVLSHSFGSESFVTPWTVAHQAPLPMGFSKQEYWSGLPSPSPGDLPDPEIEPTYLTSPVLAGRFFTAVQLTDSLTPNRCYLCLLYSSQLLKISYILFIYFFSLLAFLSRRLESTHVNPKSMGIFKVFEQHMVCLDI